MSYALAFHFDPETETRIRELWALLAEATGSQKLVESPAYPHITAAVFDSTNVWQIQRGVKIIVENNSVPEVTLHSVGSFLSSEGVVYIAPAIREDLLYLHKRLIECVQRWGTPSASFYLPGSWVPHCTLGIELTGEQIASAMQVLHENPYPITGRLDSVVLVELERLEIVWKQKLLSKPGHS